MTVFWKYVFPVIFGLLIYTSLRLVNDIISGTQFWKRHWSINAIELTTSILVSYVFAWVLNYFVKKFTHKHPGKPTVRTVLKEFLTVLLICLLIINITVVPMAAMTDDGLQMYDIVNINLIPMLYLLLYYAIARGNAYLQAFYEQQVELERVNRDHLQTELKFLKAQYHPHFLFNALNTIYFQMDENIQGAKKSIEKFSQLLRYQLYDQQLQVPVNMEIDYLQNFIDIQRLRSQENLDLKIYFDKNLNGQLVYPLLFLPLVENAFKYVGDPYWIFIEARMEGDKIIFTVNNSISRGIAVEKRNGIGLENLQRRLELLYPARHDFKIENTEQAFKAILKLSF